MEHRNGNRVTVSLPVELLRHGQSCGRFESSNIGHGGLLLNGRGMLKKGDFLTAKIANNTINGHTKFNRIRNNKVIEKHSDYFQLKVMVVHKSPSGVGLMWVDNNISFFNSLRLMHSSVA